jgi:hypothetical protein
MAYALFLNEQMIGGPFSEKSEAWADATKRGLVMIIPSFDEDPPRQILDLNCSIRCAMDRKESGKLPSMVVTQTSSVMKVPH